MRALIGWFVSLFSEPAVGKRLPHFANLGELNFHNLDSAVLSARALIGWLPPIPEPAVCKLPLHFADLGGLYFETLISFILLFT